MDSCTESGRLNKGKIRLNKGNRSNEQNTLFCFSSGSTANKPKPYTDSTYCLRFMLTANPLISTHLLHRSVHSAYIDRMRVCETPFHASDARRINADSSFGVVRKMCWLMTWLNKWQGKKPSSFRVNIWVHLVFVFALQSKRLLIYFRCGC